MTAPQPDHSGSGDAVRAALPQHKHDCDTCVFLGADGHYDLYFHPGYGQTVIARYGEDGSYTSGMAFAAPYTDITGKRQPGIAPLVEAKRRAIERGLLKEAA